MADDSVVDDLLKLDPDDGIVVAWILTAKLAAPNDCTSIITTTSEELDVVTHRGLGEAASLLARRRYEDCDGP